MSHDSYLINLGSPNSEALHKSRSAFKEELARCHKLELSFLNFHPGAALEGSEEACLDRIAASLIEMENSSTKALRAFCWKRPQAKAHLSAGDSNTWPTS